LAVTRKGGNHKGKTRSCRGKNDERNPANKFKGGGVASPNRGEKVKREGGAPSVRLRGGVLLFGTYT